MTTDRDIQGRWVPPIEHVSWGRILAGLGAGLAAALVVGAIGGFLLLRMSLSGLTDTEGSSSSLAEFTVVWVLTCVSLIAAPYLAAASTLGPVTDRRGVRAAAIALGVGLACTLGPLAAGDPAPLLGLPLWCVVWLVGGRWILNRRLAHRTASA